MSQSAARLQWLTLGLLALGLSGVSAAQLLGLLTIALTLLTALKLLEARRLEERRLVALLQLVGAGLQAALLPELMPSLLQGLAMLTALAGLLALEVGEGPDLRALLRRSGAVLLAALPIGLVLLLLVPRLGPFAVVPGLLDGAALTGLSDSLEPGSIARLADDTTPAARVSFGRGGPPAAADRYWRVLVHDRFDGSRWLAAPGARPDGTPVRPDSDATPPPGPLQELWLAEPSGLSAVPWSGRGRPQGALLRQDERGELRLRGATGQRRLYAIAAADRAGPEPWQRRPPRPLDLQLAPGRNPRLEALAARWALLPTPEQRLAAAERWFRQQGFRYSRTPGRLPEQAPLDAFLFEQREGFCGHYAAAFTALMRQAGVPARLVSGYRGGTWVTGLGGEGYLDLRRSDAHAWSEVWLPQRGWQRIDPSAWLGDAASLAPPPLKRWGALSWLQRRWWAVDLAWSRWWLGFDREAQQSLLERLLGEQQELVGVLVLTLVGGGLAGGLTLLNGLTRRGRSDPLRRELERSLALLARQGLTPGPGESLPRFLARAAGRWPALAPELEAVAGAYSQARFAPPGGAASTKPLRELRRRRRRLARGLRKRRNCPLPATAGDRRDYKG